MLVEESVLPDPLAFADACVLTDIGALADLGCCSDSRAFLDFRMVSVYRSPSDVCERADRWVRAGFGFLVEFNCPVDLGPHADIRARANRLLRMDLGGRMDPRLRTAVGVSEILEAVMCQASQTAVIGRGSEAWCALVDDVSPEQVAMVIHARPFCRLVPYHQNRTNPRVELAHRTRAICYIRLRI